MSTARFRSWGQWWQKGLEGSRKSLWRRWELHRPQGWRETDEGIWLPFIRALCITPVAEELFWAWHSHKESWVTICPNSLFLNSTPFIPEKYFPAWAIKYRIAHTKWGSFDNWQPFCGIMLSLHFICQGHKHIWVFLSMAIFWIPWHFLRFLCRWWFRWIGVCKNKKRQYQDYWRNPGKKYWGLDMWQ